MTGVVAAEMSLIVTTAMRFIRCGGQIWSAQFPVYGVVEMKLFRKVVGTRSNVLPNLNISHPLYHTISSTVLNRIRRRL